MDINYNGRLYLFDKNENITNDMFYDRCWYIAKRSPKTEEEQIEAESFADIYINMKYLGCRYNDILEKKVKLKC